MFFGETFIEIPKDDIKKITKYKESMFSNSSIIVTTINGEIEFSSFSSRNEAYDVLCETMDIDSEHAFIEEK